MKKLLEMIKNEVNRTYGFPIEESTLLRISENATFLLTDSKKKRYILRINKHGYHAEKELKSELVWMEYIQTYTDINIPMVYPNLKSQKISYFPVSTCYGNSYVIFSYIEGHSPNIETLDEKRKLLSMIGETAAKLHTLSMERISLNSLPRFTWNYEDLIGEHARWGTLSRDIPMKSDEYDYICSALEIIEKKLTSYGKCNETYSGNYGLIHGDLHPGNFIQTGDNSYSLIDFDDCGYGWFLYG